MSFRDTTSLHGWPDEDELDALRKRHTRWRIWRGLDDHRQPKGWYATYGEPITDRQLADGLRRTLDAGTSRELEKKLSEQEQAHDRA